MTSDPDSADEDFRMDAEPPVEDKPVDYEDFGRPSRFALATLFALASPFFVDGLAVLMLKSLNGQSPIVVFAIGAILGKFALLSMWLAWGSSRVIWRVLIIMVSVFFSTMVSQIDPDKSQFYLVVLLQVILCAGAIAIPRLFGARWVERWTLRAVEPVPVRRNQFSILDLLIWTTTFAIIAGVMQAIGLPTWMGVVEFGVLCLFAVPITSFFVLVAMWVELNKAESIGGFVGLMYLFLLFLTVILAAITRAPGEAFAYIFGTLATALTFILIVLHQFRRAGDRLVRARPSTSTAHLTTRSDFDDEPGEWS
jgi:hypothetical protein